MIKRCILFLISILFFIFSSSAFASCNLDTTRWKFANTDDIISSYVDSYSVRSYNNLVEFWCCYYQSRSCVKHHIGEHYHYVLTYINFNNNTFAHTTAFAVDNFGNIVDDYSSQPIFLSYPVDSNFADIADKVYEIAFGKK